jgi:hypothetical protein
MNYDWAGAKPSGEATGTKLIAWGSPYGYLGASSFNLFDYSGNGDGRGDRSYATFIVLGPKCRFDDLGMCTEPGDVARVLEQVTSLRGAQLSVAAGGSVSDDAQKGPGAESRKPISQGFDDTYAVFHLELESEDAVAFMFTPAAATAVERPIFVVHGYRGELPALTIDGAAATVNTGDDEADFFASVDAENEQLWLTLNRRVEAAVTISVKP